MIDFLKLMAQQIPPFIEIKDAIDIMLANPLFKAIAIITSIPGIIAIVIAIKKIANKPSKRI